MGPLEERSPRSRRDYDLAMTLTSSTPTATRAASGYVAARAFTATARGVDDDDLRAAFRHCVQLVRARDYETYLCTLSLPRERAPVAFAVRALNAETGSIVGNAESARARLASEVRVVHHAHHVPRDLLRLAGHRLVPAAAQDLRDTWRDGGRVGRPAAGGWGSPRCA